MFKLTDLALDQYLLFSLTEQIVSGMATGTIWQKKPLDMVTSLLITPDLALSFAQLARYRVQPLQSHQPRLKLIVWVKRL